VGGRRMLAIVKVIVISLSFMVFTFVVYAKKLDDKLLMLMEPFFRKMTGQA
jgi:hypothetical protein